MCGEQVIGFTAVAPARWKPPLEQYGFSLPPRNRVASMLPIAASRKKYFAFCIWPLVFLRLRGENKNPHILLFASFCGIMA
jgi:hypothetical protein